MSVSVTLNGTGYTIPQTDETGWGSEVTSWIQAASQHLLQKTGGTFTLTTEVDFGGSAGIKTLSYKSRSSNIATTGILRLNNNSDAIKWRNAANSADLGLLVDGSDNLEYNGIDVALTTATQTLTSKTLTSPVINNGDINTPTVDISTLEEQSSTPSNPSSGNRKLYVKNDGNAYLLDSAGTETRIGSGSSSGINYISNPDAETNTTGWNAYADAAAASPVDGTGGSPTVTMTRVTSSPLRGAAMFRITKDAANRQGEGVGYAFSIANSDKAKPLSVSFEYQPSSAFVAGDSSDIRIWLYDVTNSQLIQPAPYTIQGGSGATQKFSAIFQTNSNSTSYRLIFHIATTNASAWTFDFDNVSVGPQVLLYGSPISDWGGQSWTPTGSWTTNTTYTGQWRRVGDSFEAFVNLALTGAPNSTTLSINILSGLTIDTAKIPSGAVLGTAKGLDSGTAFWTGVVDYNSTTSVRIISTNNPNVWSETVPFTFGASDSVTVYFIVPILGWQSNVLMSNDADTRIVAARYSSNTTQSIASSTIIDFEDKVFDTHSAVTVGAAWKFSAPISGYYEIKAMAELVSGGGWNVGEYFTLRLYKNGSPSQNLASQITQVAHTEGVRIYGSSTISLIAGDYIDVRFEQNSGASINTNTNPETLWIDINKISGPSAIAATETIAASFDGTDTTSVANATERRLGQSGSLLFDTHGALNNGTFTCPVSGIYELGGGTGFSALAVNGASCALRFKKNSTIIHEVAKHLDGGTGSSTEYITVNGSAIIKALAGDTLEIVAFQDNVSASARSLLTAEVNYTKLQFIQFRRIN